jgi:hypothetical protein
MGGSATRKTPWLPQSERVVTPACGRRGAANGQLAPPVVRATSGRGHFVISEVSRNASKGCVAGVMSMKIGSGSVLHVPSRHYLPALQKIRK